MSTGARRNPSAPQATPALIDVLRTIQVALISDQLHRFIGTGQLKKYDCSTGTMAGTAVTVRVSHGDNLAVLRALKEYCRPGDVLVIDGGGDTEQAILGGIMSLYARSIGLAGVVVDGAVRDVAEIRERDFPLFARGHIHRGPYKDGPGEINVPVNIGGMVVMPGDIIMGDDDGLLAFNPAEAETLIEKALAQQAKEEASIQAILENRWDLSFVDALEARSNN
ncbi:MAG: RraA family protein [Proteobacteria bacterium]|nr:RraA family protein [Pseudomonadota bacterium]